MHQLEVKLSGDGREGSLGYVVKAGLPLEELRNVGYSARVCAAVVGVLLERRREESSVRDLMDGTGLSHAAVRTVCRDLEALEHLAVRVELGRRSRGWAAFRYRLTGYGVALWSCRRDERGSLLLPVREPEWALVRVMGARWSDVQRKRGAAPGYAFSTLERVARVLIRVPGRLWSPGDVSAKVGLSGSTVSLACRDLVAGGHAERRARLRADGLPMSCRYRLTGRGLAVWIDWFDGTG
ncbi:hypothetical protein [Actinosynnema sp. NPDC023587]|uniref:hypothetical protein n=1 Tax=Actinosynnema sp. NPDC023587 TaxID=3154695 RepID=UPI0033E654E6